MCTCMHVCLYVCVPYSGVVLCLIMDHTMLTTGGFDLQTPYKLFSYLTATLTYINFESIFNLWCIPSLNLVLGLIA